ncbi:MAG TPA: translation initiation factor eIF-2B [Candidatus Absconditabacterales bacterium]|nr:translation initiation factor eIF-2B [Candidatus Absconditabacterales bacterium]HOQ78887.1 translation initiation factor eIF-2B [Candidatus Absconditabacterales bacterium]HPK27844.1 translation initiation factor eIF-2B [Candidatus Absconditabacterales bacterium]
MSKFDNEILQVADDIRTITIQGATNIAREACKVMEKQLRLKKFSNKKELKDFFDRSTKLLIEARETEPMLRNGMKYARHKLKAGANAIELADAFAEYLTWINEEEKIRAEIGVNLIDDGDNIMTHCHSGSVTKILKTARNEGKKIHVYNTETRPLYQGRKTSTKLVEAGVPNTMVTDSSAPFFVDNIYEKDIEINKVFLGADSIQSNGDTINKVGSFAIALSAWHSGIPLYVVGSLLKLDISGEIGIETRDGKELRSDAPEGLKILNYAFDMIPAKCITGIITEFGIIRPENLLKEVKKRYPWMLE